MSDSEKPAFVVKAKVDSAVPGSINHVPSSEFEHAPTGAKQILEARKVPEDEGDPESLDILHKKHNDELETLLSELASNRDSSAVSGRKKPKRRWRESRADQRDASKDPIYPQDRSSQLVGKILGRVLVGICGILFLIFLLVWVWDPEGADWREIERGAYSYNQETADRLLKHTQRFKNCVHLAAIHTFFWERCDREGQCSDYLRYYPSGPYVAQIESKYWAMCVSSALLCSAYVDTFPSGEHVGEANVRARQAGMKTAFMRARDEDVKKELWAGPSMIASLEIPKDANRRSLIVTLAGELTSADNAMKYKIPALWPDVDLCYENSDSGLFDFRSCSSMHLNPGPNSVPLTKVEVLFPRGYVGMCKLNDESIETYAGLFLLPGVYKLRCDVFDSNSRAEGVEVSFRTKNRSGSTVAIQYVEEGGKMLAKAYDP